MMAQVSVLSLENQVFKAFLAYAGLVIVKMIGMSFITIHFRVTKKVFANEEDTVFGIPLKDRPKTTLSNPTVERVRRAHLNDLENIIPFVLLGFLYITTSPALASALLHFRIFVASRILHTVSYLFKIPQPARFLCFLFAILVNVSMAYQVISSGTF